MSAKKKALTLMIPEPCGENFNEMTPVKGGKFCGSCEKTVVDFRAMSDGQILNFHKKNNGKICGVFNEAQLNRAMPFPMEVKPNRNWKAVAALAAGLMFSGGLVGQSTTGELARTAQHMVKEKGITEKDNTAAQKAIKGQVTDMFEAPLIGASILIVGTSTGTVADIDGNFSLTIPEGLLSFEIEVSYTGYQSQTLLFNEISSIPQNKMEIVLVEGITLDEVVVSCYGGQSMIAGGISWVTTESEEIAEPEIIQDVEVKTLTPEVKVFPNPFIATLNVTYDYEEKGDFLFHLYDMNGRLIFAKTYNLLKGEQTVELDMATQHLVNGVYILQISDKQDRILATKKVFKGQA